MEPAILPQGIASTMDNFLGGGPALDWVNMSTRGFKARTVILGNYGMLDSVLYDSLNSRQDALRMQPSLQRFSAWMAAKSDATHATAPRYRSKHQPSKDIH